MLPSCINVNVRCFRFPGPLLPVRIRSTRHKRLSSKPWSKRGTSAMASAGPVSAVREGSLENRRTLLELVQELKDEVPKDYEVMEQARPKSRHDDYADLPVVDLKLIDGDRRVVVEQIGKAAREWGFFQIINHGLSVDELHHIHSQAMTFFKLAPQLKLKLGKNVYFHDNSTVKGSSLHWAESVMVSYQPGSTFEDTLGAVFPERDNKFREAMVNYCKASEQINRLILELMAENLGLETIFFSQHLNSRRTLALRLNYYPVCPQPSRTLGANEHTDGSSLTVLLQDKVGGLQIQRDGEWYGVKPIDGALVVNVGDALQAWTNGRYKSVLHRVLVNEATERLSLAAFVNVDREMTISAPDELVDEENPRQYIPFTFGEYIMQVLKTRAEDENGLRPAMDGNRVLAGFRLK